MKEHVESFSRKRVDLDNPETYKHLPDDVRLLDDLMFRKIGKALVYMDYFHPDIFPKEKQTEEWIKLHEFYPEIEGTENGDKLVEINNEGYNQRLRVYKLIKAFSIGRKHNWKNLMWFKEQVYLICDETENMC